MVFSPMALPIIMLSFTVGGQYFISFISWDCWTTAMGGYIIGYWPTGLGLVYT